MHTIGLDLHKRESQLCIIGFWGEITEKRIVTSRERFTAVLLGRLLAGYPSRLRPRASGCRGTWSPWGTRSLLPIPSSLRLGDEIKEGED
jgi:hypothetical protein